MSSVLQRKVLVLNKYWTAIGLCTVRRALTMVFKELAEILDSNQTFTWEEWQELRPAADEDCLNTVSLPVRVPNIITVNGYVGVAHQRQNYSRKAIFRRDNHICQYCGERFGVDELTSDHVIPRAQGGKTSWENCVASCVSCNSKKANRTPEQAGMRLLSTPRRPKVTLFKSDSELRVKAWEPFLGKEYWL